MAGGAVSSSEVLLANFPAQALLSLGLCFALERDRLGVLGQLLAWEWGVVAGVSLGINWAANLLQQLTIRWLGAAQVGLGGGGG